MRFMLNSKLHQFWTLVALRLTSLTLCIAGIIGALRLPNTLASFAFGGNVLLFHFLLVTGPGLLLLLGTLALSAGRAQV